MSFAIAEYIKHGKDIIIATDSRWVSGSLGSYVIEDDNGLKNLDLGPKAAIAFTGHARAMAEIMRDLYDDDSLLDAPQRDALKRLESRPHDLGLDLGSIVSRLNEIIPHKLCVLGAGYQLSVILAGIVDDMPTMYWWAEETHWEARENPVNANPRVRTLPPEATLGSALQQHADQILDGHGSPAARIRRTVKFFSNRTDVESVGGGCVMRQYSKDFIRPQRS